MRCAIQYALTQIETKTPYGLPLDECEEVFRSTIRYLEEGHSAGPVEAGMGHVNRLGLVPFHGCIWSEVHTDDVIGQAFRKIIFNNYGGPLCAPTADELAMLEKGAALLGELLPRLSQSALSHVHVIALFPPGGPWKRRASSSQFLVGGTIFLNRERLVSPWWVAEHLLHEALHQKLYDFRHGHSLLGANAMRDDAPKVCSLWNVASVEKSNYWDVFRAVAAFHVYVHLFLLSTVAERRAPDLEPIYGPATQWPGTTASGRALQRAHYLGEQIRRVCWDDLGAAGRRLTEWLLSVLDAIDPSPRPVVASIHLLLDLYQREVRRIEALLRGRDSVDSDVTVSSSPWLRDLTNLAYEEVEGTRQVLRVLQAEDALASFNVALAQYSDSQLGARFPQIRRLVADALFAVSRDEHRLGSPPFLKADEIVKEMVHRSSEHLDTMLQTKSGQAVA